MTRPSRLGRLFAVLLGLGPAGVARGAAPAPECPVLYNQSVLASRVALAEERFVSDPDAFTAAVAEMVEALDCLAEPIGKGIAARYHRVRALSAWQNQQMDVALASLSTAKALEPDYQFPSVLLPPDHTLREAYATLRVSGASRTAPLPRDGTLAFDGLATRRYAADRPAIVQFLDHKDQVVWTEDLAIREDLPDYTVYPRTRLTLIGIAAGGLLVSGATFGFSRIEAARFDNEKTTTLEELESAQRTTNLMATLSLTTGLIGVGSGIGAIAVGNR